MPIREDPFLTLILLPHISMAQVFSAKPVGVRAVRSLAHRALPFQVGRWLLVRLLGQGRFCCVFQARMADGTSDQTSDYAVKLLRPQWEKDPRAITLLRREAVFGRKFSHPNLISILAFGVQEPPYFVVMPHLEGSTLRCFIDAPGRLSLPASLGIIRQAAQALQALEARQWLHGDVKPSNIFVSPTGHVTLIDLGFLQSWSPSPSSEDRPVLGTLSYIAPEMFCSALRPDIRSDIYSLGVTLYELLSGRLPFAADSPEELAAKHRQSKPADLRTIVPHLPHGVVELVHQMLAKESLRRPQTPGELVDRFVRFEIATFKECIAV